MQKKKNIGSTLLIIIGIAALVFALAKIVPTLMDYYKSEQAYDKLEEEVVEYTDPEDEDKDIPDWQKVVVKFDKLRKINPDVVAWLRFDNQDSMPTNYPVLYSGDNSKYLRHNLYGDYYIAGSIFIEGQNKPDFTDLHTIIYGHNMRNITMFGSLKQFKKSSKFYKDHQYFTIYTPDMIYHYRIFSYHDTRIGSSVYQIGFSPDETYKSWLNKMASASYYDTGITPDEFDKVVTLSTCTQHGSPQRFVVQAVLVGEYQYR